MKLPEIYVTASRVPNYDKYAVTVLRYHYEEGRVRVARCEYLDPDSGWTEYAELHGAIRPAFEINGLDLHYDRALRHSIKALIAGDDAAIKAVEDAAETGVRRVLVNHG